MDVERRIFTYRLINQIDNNKAYSLKLGLEVKYKNFDIIPVIDLEKKVKILKK